MLDKTFKQLEHEGWERQAATYDDWFARVTQQAIGPILTSFGNLSGKRFLDIACGTGHLAGQAAAHGAQVEGIDFAEAMVWQATQNYPEVKFSTGDAEALSYPDQSFDAVACAFGLLHMANPEAAIAEAYRVLRPGGRYALAVWCSPQEGNEYLGLVLGAIQTHGSLDVPLPPAPPFFRFADEQECRTVLMAVGFGQVAFSVLPITWQGREPHDVLDLMYKSTVRGTLLLAAQTDEARSKIHQAILEGAERYRRTEGLTMALPVKLVVASRML